MPGTIIQFIFLLIAHAAAGIYASHLKYSKKRIYIIWGIWVLVQTGLLFYTEFVMTNWAAQFFVGFILPFVGQYGIFFATTKGRPANRIFTMMTYSVFFCIGMSLITMVNGSFSDLHWSLLTLIQAAVLLVIELYFLCYVCPLCRTAARNITTGWAMLIFANCIFLVTIILSSVFPVRLLKFEDSGVITFIFLSVSIMAVYPVIFSNINNLSEVAIKREVETQNKLLVAQIEAETMQLAADRQARHDRRHHNLVMLEFANNNDIESVREYLKSLVESDSEIRGEAGWCDNRTINTVLTAYERRAKESNISVKISAKADREIGVLPRDLVIVIANLFENAILAAEKCKNQSKWIDISIKNDAQRLLIKMENPCKRNMTFDENSYGVGVHSIIATTQKYEGMYDFSAEGGVFSAKISLNLK